MMTGATQGLRFLTIHIVCLISVFYALNANVLAQWVNPVQFFAYKTFDSITGDEVLWKGVAYYPRPNTGSKNVNSLDYFSEANEVTWRRDINFIKDLGANLIRIYAVDPSVNHDKFMCALSQAGIYAIIEVGAQCEGCAITGYIAPECYAPSLKNRAEMIINAFSTYPNVLAFEAGNEINHAPPAGPTLGNAPCQKKLIEDMRSYINSCHDQVGMRRIPVGLSLADYGPLRAKTMQYFQCTDKSNVDAAEWVGLNPYVFCDGSVANWDQARPSLGKLLTDLKAIGLMVPFFLTEFGCLNPSFPTIDGSAAQRTWVDARLMLENMNDYIAGACAFEYSMEAVNSMCPYPFNTCWDGNFGLGYFSPQDCNDIDRICTYNPLPNFYNLKKQWAQASPVLQKLTNFKADTSRLRASCPTDIPPLESFTWTSDSIVSSYCWKPRDITCGSDSSGRFNGAIPAPTPVVVTAVPPPTPSRSTSTPSTSSSSKSATTVPGVSTDSSTRSSTTNSESGTKTVINTNAGADSGGGLSTTAVILIGLGCAIAGSIAIAAVGFYGYARYRKKKEQEELELVEAENIIRHGEQENTPYSSM